MRSELKCKNCGKILKGKWKRFCSLDMPRGFKGFKTVGDMQDFRLNHCEISAFNPQVKPTTMMRNL